MIIFLCCRTKKIGQHVSPLSMSKATNPFPISESNNEWEYECDTFTSLSIMILLLLCVIYLIIQYSKFGRQLFNHLALPFIECISAKNTAKCRN